MTRTFTPWVEPIATKVQESRTQIVEVARSIPEQAWTRPSPNQDWSYRDLLVHLAVGDWVSQTVLRAIITNEPLNIGEVASLDWISQGNRERLSERQERTVDELIAEVAAEGDETQELLARLAEADESRTQEDAPLNLGDYLRGFPGHDRTHLAELSTALEAGVTERTFASWVEPVAARTRGSRARVLEYVRARPEDVWATPSPLDGWSCKDVLAHIGRGNDQMFQAILREVIAGSHLDRSIFAVDTDGENARLVEERRDRPVADIIAELEESGDEVQELLSQLTDEAEGYRQEDPPFILSGFIRLVHDEDHDEEHLAQLRTALEAQRIG